MVAADDIHGELSLSVGVAAVSDFQREGVRTGSARDTLKVEASVVGAGSVVIPVRILTNVEAVWKLSACYLERVIRSSSSYRDTA